MPTNGAKVYSYTRFSDPKQALGHSADRQLQYAKAWAAERGLALDESLSLKDEGLSAFHQRHIKQGALGGFLLAVDEGRIPSGSVLIVEGLDRLSRAEPIQAQAQLAQFINAGITVVTASDGREYNRENYGPATQVERLKAFFDAQSLNDVVLIGSSIGGCIACLFAAAYPASVSRLIAMAPAGLQAVRPTPAMRQFFDSGKHPFGYRSVSEMQGLWAIVFTRAPKVPAFLAKALAIKGALRYAKVGKILGDFKDAGLYPLQGRLADVQARTLIVWGSNDRVFDISCLDEVYSLLPQASVCIIEGAGHVPYLECADQTLDAIQRFLD